MSQVILQVEGMSCNHCVVAIEQALNEVDAKGKVDLENHKVLIDYDSAKQTLEDLIEIIEDQGYEVKMTVNK